MTDRTFTKTITTTSNGVIDTMFSTEDDVSYGRKFYVSSFQGDGHLEVSDNKTNWTNTTSVENTLIDPDRSIPRYARINGTTGDKVVHLITLDR